jgi:putative DNA primase/helicase
LAGVDLDGCRNPRTGEIEARATEIVKGLGSYTELSPSETGLKVFVCGELPLGRWRKGNIEMYDRGRFFTTTGLHLLGLPRSIQARQSELTTLHRCVFGDWEGGSRAGVDSRVSAGLDISDEKLLDRARSAANGDRFASLWAGDTSDYKTTSNEGRSEADLALCSLLAFWSGPDEARIDSGCRRFVYAVHLRASLSNVVTCS